MKGFSFLKSSGLQRKKTNIREFLSHIFLDSGVFLLTKSYNYQNDTLPYEQNLKHITLKSFECAEPTVEENSYIAHLAHLYGNVTVGKGARVEPFTTIKALNYWVELCDNTYIGRYVAIHVRDDLSSNIPKANSIGEGSFIEDRCFLMNAVLGENVWVGEGSVLQEGCVVQDSVRILPGTVIGPNKVLISGFVYGGTNGGDVVRPINEQDATDFEELKRITNSDLEMMDEFQLGKYYYIKS